VDRAATERGSTAPELGGAADTALVAARIDRIPMVPFHRHMGRTLGLGTFFDGFDAISVAVVLAVIVQVFGIDFSTAGLIISAGYVGQLLGALGVGALSDRIGRRRAFVLSLVVFGALSLASAFAWSATSLMVFRLLQGIGLGGEVPVAGALLSEYLGVRNRGRASVVYQTAFMMWGFFFAPLVALASITTFGAQDGWRVLFAIGALPLLLAAYAWFRLPESARWLAQQGRGAEADALVTRMEQQARAAGHELVAPVPAQASAGRLRTGEIFAPAYRRRTAMLAAVWFTAFFVTYGYTVWLPTLYVSVGGLPPTSSLALTVVLGAVTLAMVYANAYLVETVGRKPLLTTGFAVMATGALLAAVLTGPLGARTWQTLFGCALVLAVGATLVTGSLYFYTAELFPTRMRGWATSACSSMNRLASVLSPILVGALLDGAGGVGAVFGCFAVAALVGAVVMGTVGIETRGRSLEDISG
jgi:putative MFS transporter